MQSYEATTDDITVTVRPMYLDGQSDFLARRFVFAYSIIIENKGTESVQLMRRHWLITNARGEVNEVEGEGVIGKQPVIDPGASHEYASYSVLETFEGTMEGSYVMQKPDGGQFMVVIHRFVLRAAAN